MTAPDWLNELLAGDHEYRMPINPEGDTAKNILYIGKFGAAHIADMVWAEFSERIKAMDADEADWVLDALGADA